MATTWRYRLKTMKYITYIILLLVSLNTWANVFEKDKALENLEHMKAREYFSPDSSGLYTGVRSEVFKLQLETQYQAAITAFINHTKSGATERSYQELVKKSISTFKRDMLDTEDAVRVATNFEKLMDAIGLFSSGGAINIWMYGFDPTKG